jgi:hypothetical protein
VDGQSSKVIAANLALTRVQADVQVDSKFLRRLGYRLRATNRPSRAVEGRDEPIASGVDLSASKSPELFANRTVVSVEQRSPAFVAK